MSVLWKALTCVLLFLICSNVSGQPVELCDERGMAEWDADPAYWRYESGSLIGEIAPGTKLTKNTWLVWKGGDVEDFELRVRFKLSGAASANSGIQVRCQVKNVDHVSGYQADLDMGSVWLGRIYDEHGRALLVERGSRVHIAPDGSKKVQAFAPANEYAVLFRDNDWNDYRIVAVGNRIDVYVNGTLFSQLQDEQSGELDLRGKLAFQLHSGGETRIEYQSIVLEKLAAADKTRLAKFEIRETNAATKKSSGMIPKRADGAEMNLGFESGTLDDWTATGDAFDKQPLNRDGIAARWPGQVSNKTGDYFIGGFESKRDAGTGTLTSKPFSVTQPYLSFLIGGGNTPATRVELVTVSDDGQMKPFFTAVGENREQLRRVVADVRAFKNKSIAVRLVDESQGGWGHLNFDDVRFHEEPPESIEPNQAWRSTFNPVLQHLVANPVAVDQTQRGTETAAQMFVPEGFSVDVIAAEPLVHQPIAFSFDAKGRIWVVEGHSYPQKRPEGEGLDRIVIFSDGDGDGQFESRHVFYEGLNLVSGIEVGHGGVWIGAAPQLLFIPDRDRDDRADEEPEVVLDGFGFADTHETLNSLMWGPDGWLYGTQGVFNSSRIGKPNAPAEERIGLGAGVWRYHPTRRVFEVFAHGTSNPWGLDYDELGQIFMTHCRSYWGQGLTTHVMQGGHYWNQVNGGYAPFISSTPLPGIETMKNYLLASARYDHGEGGAGKKGTGQVYGGHSHVGTMFYLGDNWPEEYRNHLFTHNLHGHQINHQVNVREAGGYRTRHAGTDVLFCGDPQFIGVDLQVGPDGAVYLSDWYDPRHCHNPNLELWDRGNGRIYRMKYDASFLPARVDYFAASDEALVKAQLHRNDWHARMARLMLSERAAHEGVSKLAVEQLLWMASAEPRESYRLRAVWGLHAANAITEEVFKSLLRDPSEAIRGWAIQLKCEGEISDSIAATIAVHARTEKSLLVQRYLASAIQRLPRKEAWHVAEQLAQDPEVNTDRDLPLILWHGLAVLAESDSHRALSLADSTAVPAVRDYLIWYVAKSSAEGRDKIAQRLKHAAPDDRLRLLKLFAHAIRGMRGLKSPEAWEAMAESMYASKDVETRQAAEALGAAFSDPKLFEKMRERLKDGEAKLPAKKHALSILAYDDSKTNFPIYVSLLDDAQLAAEALPRLRTFDESQVAETVLERLPKWDGKTQDAAMELLVSRPAWGGKLLDAIASGSIGKERLTAYYARQLANLGDDSLKQRLVREWGNIGGTSAELRQEITKTANAFKTAPLWAYDAGQGAAHFKRLCAACHAAGAGDERIAPKLAGTGAKGVDYIIENVIDPNAVIGRDFQARLVLTQDGQVITGLIQQETETALTLKTATSEVTVNRSDIEAIRVSEQSFMPVGLLQTLNERERIELLKYLMSL